MHICAERAPHKGELNDKGQQIIITEMLSTFEDLCATSSGSGSGTGAGGGAGVNGSGEEYSSIVVFRTVDVLIAMGLPTGAFTHYLVKVGVRTSFFFPSLLAPLP